MGFFANYMRNLLSLAFGGVLIRPLLFSYYVTHRCSLKCCYCSDGQGRPFSEKLVSELGTDDAGKLISLLSQATDTLDITGGEPLMREDLEELLAFAHSCGIRTILNTNGISLPARPEVMRHCDIIVISLDSMSPEVLNEIIGDDKIAAESILDAVRFACSQRSQTKTQVVLSAVAIPGFLDEARKVMAFAVENGLAFQLSPQLNGMTIHHELADNDEYRKLINDVIACKRNGGKVLGIERYFRGIRDITAFDCHPLLMPTIQPDASMYYPCLECGVTPVNILEAGSYSAALQSVHKNHSCVKCQNRCHIFCHMALSLLQRHPIDAMSELKYMRS